MVNVSKKELEKLDIIDFGTLAVIYRKDDKIYKVYKDKIKTANKVMIDNPVLKKRYKSINRCNAMIELKRFIKNTDLIDDLLYIDGTFYGVVMPYYEGKSFSKLTSLPFEERLKYSYQLVSNAKELTDYYIYNLDYSLKNVMVVDDKVKIIDLDDVLTKIWLFKNPFLEKKSISELDYIIKNFLKERYYGCRNIVLRNLIEFESHPVNTKYIDIKNYLNEKSVKKNVLFLDEKYDSCIDRVYSNHVVFVYEKYDLDYIMHCLSLLKDKGIIINDVVDKNDIDNYMQNISSNSCLKAEGSKILKLK